MRVLTKEQKYYLEKTYTYLTRKERGFMSQWDNRIILNDHEYDINDIKKWIVGILKDEVYTEFQAHWLNDLKRYYLKNKRYDKNQYENG